MNKSVFPPTILLGWIAVLLLSALPASSALAAACTSVASNNWSAATTWAAPCNVAGGPTGSDTVTIAAAHTVTVDVNSAATSITVTAPSGATHGVTLGAGVTLNVSGAITMAAPAANNRTSTFAVGSGTLSAASIAISGGTGGTRISQLTVSTGTITTTGAVTMGGTAAQSRVIASGASTITIGGNFTPGAFTPGASTLTVSGNFAPTTMAAGGTGTVIFTGGAAQTVGAFTTYNNVTINKSAGTASLAGTTTIGGALNVTSGTLSAGTVTMTVNGATTVNGIFSVAGTTLTMNGTTTVSGAGSTLNITSATGTKTFVGAVDINSGGTWNNSGNEAVTFRNGLAHSGLSFNAGTGVYTFNTNPQVISGTLSIPSITVTTPTVLTNNDTLTVGTALSGTGSLTNTGTLNIGGASGITGLTANAVGNTVNYSGAAQTIKTPTGTAPLAYHHLQLSGSGAKTAAAGLIVNGDLTLSGTATLTAGAFTHNFYGNWIVNTAAAAPLSVTTTSVINFNAPTPAAATSISGTTTATLAFSDVNINNTSGVNFNENASFQTGTTPTLTVAAGATLTPAAGVILSGTTGTLTGNGTVQVTRTAATAGFSQQYTINTKTLTNLTVEYAGVGTAQTVSSLAYGGLKINNASNVSLAGITTVGGTLTLTSGTLTVGANTLALNGPAIAGTETNLITTSSSTLSFGGSSIGVYVPSSVTALSNLTVNNANGVSLHGDVGVSTLTLTNGTLSTSAFKLSTSTNCPASINRTTGYVDGNLRLTFPTNTTTGTTCTFHVGSGTTYAPIGITLITTIFGGGTLTGSTTGYEHPQISTSGIDANRDVNRYWTLWSTGDTVSAASYSSTFNFVAGDVDVLATTGNFVVGKYVTSPSPAWSLITPPGGAALATSTGISIAAGITVQTDFAVGEAAFVCSVPAGSPAGTTCVCDNFNRATLNPSTIYDGNWNVSTISGTFGLPRIVSNRLRLTDNTTLVSTAATAPGTFPAAGNWITVEFLHYAYNGTGGGADGIAFTLSDATIPVVPGAFGGSLGFAQKCQNGVAGCSNDCNVAGGCPGFTGGWIGLGVDEWGNYSNSNEGRSGGPGQRADSVAVRGSGSGQIGYPYLDGTNTLSPGIDNTGSTTPAYGHSYRLTVDARNYTWNGSSGTKTATVSLERDTAGGTNYSALVTPFDAYVKNPSQADVPVNWQLSFTGSTGASSNIHEITGLKICAQTYVPPAGYRILVDNFSPTTCPSDPQPTVTISALNTNGQVITTYTNTVSLSATLASGGGGGTSSATWTPYPSNQGTWDSVNKRYTFVSGDNGVAKFYLSDLVQQDVYITASEYLGTLNTSLGTPVQYSSGVASFVVNIPPAETLGSDVVAGRAHLMRITRNQATCGGGVNTTFTGAKPLDGWYTPALGDHPNGAAAPQICATNAGGTCLPTTGSCQTLSIAAPVVSASSNNLNLTFASGIADFCLVTTDVGKYTISLRDDTTAPAALPPPSGTSTPLTARPFALVVNDVKQGSISNPGGTATSGSKFVAAGDTFQATVGAYLWQSTGSSNLGSGDANGDGFPDAGASLASVTAGGAAPYYYWDTVLAGGSPYTPAAGTLASFNTTLSGPCPTGAPNCFSSGVATPNTLTYAEVGSFTMTASATNFLNSGITLATRMYDNSNTYQPGGLVVGRVYPDHFAFSASSITPPLCGAGPGNATFIYMGQPFGLAYSLEAQNKLNTATQNYFSAGYNVATPTLVAEDGAATNQGADLGSRISGLGAPTWSTGVYSVSSSSVVFSRPTTPVALDTTNSTTIASTAPNAGGPFDTLSVGVKMLDADGGIMAAPDMRASASGVCTSPGTNVNTDCDAKSIDSTKMRFGILRLDSASGSQLLDMQVPFRAMHMSSAPSQFVVNDLDSCTTIAPANIAIGNQTPAGFAAYFNMASNRPLSSTQLNAGIGTLVLRKPSPASIGKADIAINLGSTGTPSDVSCNSTHPATTAANLPWLQGRWGGSTGCPSILYDRDPNSSVTFGTKKSIMIYLREKY